MALIPKQNEIDVYLSEDKTSVMISEEAAIYVECNGDLQDAIVEIPLNHIETVVNALLRCKKEAEQGA